MRMTKYSSETLEALLDREKVVSLEALKRALGTTSRMTVFRKLKSLSYRASYSHTGKFYALDSIANYDRHGLWAFRQVCFSKYGSLLNTAEALVCASPQGYLAHELQSLVHVRVQTPLLKLVCEGRLRREAIAGGYVYLSFENGDSQLKARQEQQSAGISTTDAWWSTAFEVPEIRESLVSFLNILNEKQRRLYVGFESMRLGRGGDTVLSRLSGMNVKTIARGRRELASQKITPERVRQVGGGRHSLEKKRKFSKS